jgi:uncharacterized protein
VHSLTKIQTTIPQLDSFLDGGLEPGTLSCIWTKPGLDGTAFAYHLANSASKGSKTFYVVNSKSPAAVKEEMKGYGFPSTKINFIDAYSALVGAKAATELAIANPKDTDEILEHLSIITKKIKNPVIILDSFSTLIDLTEHENTDFITKLKKLPATVICLFTEWAYKPELIKGFRNTFDTIIEVQSVEEKLFFRQYFGVTKLKSGTPKKQVIPFKIVKPGGIKIYIPKILVTGPFNAGKTSFIHSSSERAVSVDRLGTTIALDHGHVKYKDFTVDLFGTPGQQRFDPILKLLGGEALGVIVVVSSTDPQGFPRALEMMKKAEVFGLPFVIAANKSNLRGALTVAQVTTGMKLKEGDIVPVSAVDLTKVQPGLPCQLKQKDIEKVLDVLFAKLLRGGLK